MRRSEKLGLLAILILALGLSLAYFIEQRQEPVFQVPLVDARFHEFWARGLAFNDWSVREDEIGYGDALRLMIKSRPFFRPPGYPYFLAGVFRITGGNHELAVLFQMLLGTGNVLLICFLGRKLFGTLAGFLCASLLACYWPLVYFETQFEEPVLLTFLMLIQAHLFFSLASRAYWPAAFAAGTVLGLMALIRPNALVLFPVLTVWLAFVWRKLVARRSLFILLTVVGLGTLTAIAPATLHNWRLSREAVLISANTGINLHIGNHEGATGFFTPDTPEINGFETSFDYPRIVEQLEERLGHRLTYTEVSNYFAAKAVRFIFRRPKEFLRLTLKRIALLFGPEEIGHNREIRLDRMASPLLRWNPFDFPLALALASLGLATLIRGSHHHISLPAGRGPARPVLNCLLAFTLLALVYLMSFSVFFVTALFRIPVVPFFLVLGSGGVVFLRKLWRHGHRKRVAGWVVGFVLVYLAARFPVIQCEPDKAKWHYDRGLASQLLGRYELALSEFEQALKIIPDDAAAHANLGTLLARQGRFEQALAHFRFAFGQQAENLFVRRCYAVCLIMLDRSAEALSVLTSTGRDHDDQRTMRLLGICHAELENHEEAVSSLRKAVAAEPQSLENTYNLQQAILLAGIRETPTVAAQKREPPPGSFLTRHGFAIPPDW